MGSRKSASDNGPTGIPWDDGSPRDPDYDYGDHPSTFAPKVAEFEALPVQVQFDPILRLALIRKGIITPEDLKSAEEEIRVTSGMMNAAHIGEPFQLFGGNDDSAG